jgi:hypothetical protein
MEFASNFILKAALSNARVLSRAETPPTMVSNGAAWRSDDAIGFVRIIPAQGGVKGLDIASSIVANDAKDCKGKFASARNSELVDSDVVFRGMSSTCQHLPVFHIAAEEGRLCPVLGDCKSAGGRSQEPVARREEQGFQKGCPGGRRSVGPPTGDDIRARLERKS